MIRPNIQAIAARLAAELRIQDRIIDTRYVRGLADERGNPLYGQLRIDNLDEGRFSVLIQDPETWPMGGPRPLSEESIEEAVTHEHVHIRWIDRTADKSDPAALLLEERATWATAQALVRAGQRQRAAIVRSMVALRAPVTKVLQAATRRQQKGRRMAMDPATAKLLLDASESDDAAAMKQAIRKIVEDALTDGNAAPDGPDSTPDGNVPPMGQGAAGMNDKDKGPMGMTEKYQRAMATSLAEVERSTAIIQTDAKRAIVRGMKADGIALTPHAEKKILEAKTIEAAQDLEAMARSMAGEPVPGADKKPASPPGDKSKTAGLTREQAASYSQKVRDGNPRAEAYRAQCLKANEAARAANGGA